MALRANFLYRPGLWELWWLLTEFLKHSLVFGLPVALILQKIKKFKGLAVAFGLAPALAWLGWPGWLGVGAFGAALAKRETEPFTLFLSAGVGLYSLAHAKEMAEVLLPLLR